jgi:hypothetical protein
VKAFVITPVILALSAEQVGAQFAYPDVATIPPAALLERSTDEFTGHTRWRSAAVILASEDTVPDGSTVELFAQRFLEKGQSVATYQLFFEYRATDWIFVSEQHGLTVLIDGVATSLPAASTHRGVPGRGIIERLMYEVSPPFLRRIIAGKVVKVRLTGERYYVNRIIGPGSRAIISAVLNPTTTLARADSARRASLGRARADSIALERLRDPASGVEVRRFGKPDETTMLFSADTTSTSRWLVLQQPHPITGNAVLRFSGPRGEVRHLHPIPAEWPGTTLDQLRGWLATARVSVPPLPVRQPPPDKLLEERAEADRLAKVPVVADNDQGEGFRRVRHKEYVSYVEIPLSRSLDTRVYDAAVERFCPPAVRPCRIYFFSDKAAPADYPWPRPEFSMRSGEYVRGVEGPPVWNIPGRRPPL